jgi:hypothetical protein
MTMRTKATATARAARDELARLDAELGLPIRGVHVGTGRHVDLDAPGRIGWKRTAGRVITHADGTAAVVVSAEVAARMTGVVVDDPKWVPLAREASPVRDVVALERER